MKLAGWLALALGLNPLAAVASGSALSRFLSEAASAAPSGFVSMRGAPIAGPGESYEVARADSTVVKDCKISLNDGTKDWNLLCQLSLAADLPAAQQLLENALPPGFEPTINLPDFWSRADGVTIALFSLKSSVYVHIWNGPKPPARAAPLGSPPSAPPLPPGEREQIRAFVTQALGYAGTDFASIRSAQTQTRPGADSYTLTISTEPAVNDCAIENYPGISWDLSCALQGVSVAQATQIIEAVENSLPSGFERIGPERPSATVFWPYWVRYDDYSAVVLNALLSPIRIVVRRAIAPTAANAVDGSLNPVPVFSRFIQNGVPSIQFAGSGIVIAEDGQHSYVVAKLAPGIEKQATFLGSYVLPERWRRTSATLVTFDEASHLAIFSTPRMIVKPATFQRDATRGRPIHIFFNDTCFQPSGDIDWHCAKRSDDGIVNAIHDAPASIEYSAGNASSWPGSVLVDAQTNTLVGYGDSAIQGASAALLADPGSVLAILAKRANLSLAFAGGAPTTLASSSGAPATTARAVDPVTPYLPSIARIRTHTEWGTGVVVANTAQTTYVLTAAHVLKGDTSAKVYLPSFRDARLARAVRVDAAHDLALLAFDHADATVVPLAANAGRAQAIAVIGFPQSASAFEGNGDAVRPKLTEGVISSVDDAAGTMVYDAVTDFGNSGGPIVDLAKHQLVGIALGEPSPGNFTGASLSILRTFLSAPLP